ncbi:MAG: DUF4886 domain-containing protein [Candidatus Cryptobacteroides sp.]
MKIHRILLSLFLGICACSNPLSDIDPDGSGGDTPGQEEDTPVFTVEGKTSISADGGTLTLTVTRNIGYVLDIPVSWISLEEAKAYISEQLRLNVDPNESTQARSADLVFKPEGAEPRTVTVSQEGVRQNGISSAADFIAFAQAVNSGKSLERFCNEAGEVVLLNDIDLKGYDPVTVGMPSTISNSETSMSYEGAAFKGVFDGRGHCISNVRLDQIVPAESTYGLFGVLDGGTVRNLVLGREGDESAAYILAKAQADAGILVGTACNGAVIENCVNNVPLIVKGTETNKKRFSCGVFAGYACSTDKAVRLNSLVNNADIKASPGANTQSTATGVMVGGIAGFCTGSGTQVTMVENCENNGNVEANCGRSAGVVASMNANSMMRYCTNRGNQTNNFVKGRIGNLCCVLGVGCTMDDCTNYGDVVTSDTETSTGGMAALLDAEDAVVSGGGNYGKVISANGTYHGLLVANFSKFASVKGCYAGGSCGTYSQSGSHTLHELTADNWIRHIGYYSENNFAKITDVSSPWGGGGATDAELQDASLRILFIGNSFTKDAVEHLPGIIAASGITDVTLAHCYYGGRTIPEYYTDRETANNTFFYSNPGDGKWITAVSKASIKSIAESGRWDIVTIQEHTGHYLAWNWTDEEKTAISDLVEYVCSTQTTRPKVCYILSQAYYDMGRITSVSTDYVTWTDQAGMYAVLVAQAKKVLEESPVDDILATGTMLQNLRTSWLDNSMNLTRDGYHMDYGISRYGAACLLFEKLVGPVFGKTLDGNTYRYDVSNTTSGSYSTPVTDGNAPTAIRAARYAIETPLEVTPMD